MSPRLYIDPWSQGSWDPDNLRCVNSCPKTPWAGSGDVSLELTCSTEAAVLSYDLSKLLVKNFKDLRIELSQEKEENLVEDYTFPSIDQYDRENEVSDMNIDK